MSKIIDIEATEKTPGILFDKETRNFLIQGTSRPEDVREFYLPVYNLLNDFFSNAISSGASADSLPYKFNFRLEYFNSSSAKFIADILLSLAEQNEKGFNIKVYWHYDEGDDDMHDAGEDFAQMTGFSFNYVMIKSKE